MQLSCTTQRIYEYALSLHFFSSFRSRKKCEETARLARGKWNMWNMLSESPDLRFWSRNHALENPVAFFNFIDLQPRYRTSSIGYPFKFQIPVITVSSRGTEGFWKRVFCALAFVRVCGYSCVFVRVFVWMCVYLCDCLCACLLVCVCSHTHTHTYTRARARAHTSILTLTQPHADTDTNAHTNAHACTLYL